MSTSLVVLFKVQLTGKRSVNRLWLEPIKAETKLSSKGEIFEMKPWVSYSQFSAVSLRF